MNICVYYETWTSTRLGDLAKDYPGLTIVNLAFAQPDLKYVKGQLTWTGTGLNFTDTFPEIQSEIKALQANGIKVMLSVGGGTYQNWGAMDIVQVHALITDLGVDGVDIDWEPMTGPPVTSVLTGLIKTFRPIVGKLSFAGWSTGAYGANVNDQFSGINIPAITTVGSSVDWINIMAYDAGPPAAFNPLSAFDAYRIYYKGPLMLGFEVGPPGWGGYLLTQTDVVNGISHVNKSGSPNGIFVWGVGSDTTGTPTVGSIISTANAAFSQTVTPPPIVTPTTSSFVCPNCAKVLVVSLK